MDSVLLTECYKCSRIQFWKPLAMQKLLEITTPGAAVKKVSYEFF